MTLPLDTTSPPYSPPPVLPIAVSATLAAGAAAALIQQVGIHLPGCPMKTLTSLDCPGCGVTRSVTALAQTRFADAFDHNALVPLAVIAVVVGAAAWLAKKLGYTTTTFYDNKTVQRLGIVVVVAFTVVRLFPVGPGKYLASGLSTP